MLDWPNSRERPISASEAWQAAVEPAIEYDQRTGSAERLLDRFLCNCALPAAYLPRLRHQQHRTACTWCGRRPRHEELGVFWGTINQWSPGGMGK